MRVDQIVIITILSIAGAFVLGSWIVRMGDLDDNLWVEPVILVVLGFFIYLTVNL